MRSVWLAIPLVFAVQLAAHGTQAQPAAAAPIPNPAITVTGCVQANPAGSGGPSSTANAAANLPAGSTPYVLANANKRPADGDAAAAAPAGASGAASGRPSNAVGTGGTTDVTSYALHGRADELAAHVGHRVEITGTASETAPSAEVAAGAPQQQVIPHEPQRGPVNTVASPDASARTAHPSVQHLSVQSVKMLDATCK